MGRHAHSAETEPNQQRLELLLADGDQQAAIDALSSLGAAQLEARNDSTRRTGGSGRQRVRRAADRLTAAASLRT